MRDLDIQIQCINVDKTHSVVATVIIREACRIVAFETFAQAANHDDLLADQIAAYLVGQIGGL